MNPLDQDPLKLKTALDWIQKDSDQSICEQCKMMIVSKTMWQYTVWIGYEPIHTRIKLCESCYDKSMEEK